MTNVNSKEMGVIEEAVTSGARKAVQSVKKIENLPVDPLKSNQQMIRALIILVVLVILSIGLLEYFRRMWKDDFELRFPLGGAAIVLHSSANASDFRSAVFIVPASKCWINTGLEIKKGEHINIRASGQINLAADLIKRDKILSVPWSEPDGIMYHPIDNIDRKHLLILPHYDQNQNLLVGNLVGYFLPVDEAEDRNVRPSANKPRPSKYGPVFHIGTKLENKLNDTGKTVNLWLTVNDVVLDSSSREAYLGSKDSLIAHAVSQFNTGESIDKNEILDAKRNAEKLWNNKYNDWPLIKSGKVWDLYYQNNIGHYLVTIVKY